nr:DUF6282 family protein [uncultured Sphaerochaeta sp.]
MKSFIKGAYDLHIHSAPDVLARRMDDIDMAQRVIASGMAGYAIKSHYFCTSERAQLVNKMYPGCEAIGTLTLNSSVGGINPSAIEMACRSGIKLVWMPTCDSENERTYVFSDRCKVLPYWAKIVMQLRDEGISNPNISLIDENGVLRDTVLEVLDIIAKYDIILATSHISHKETFALVPEAARRGIKRIVITHVTFPNTYYTIEEQKKLVEYGAYMEHCYTTYATGKSTFEDELEQIRAIGADHVILTTDLGQKTALYPDEGLQKYCEDLSANGFSDEEIHKMVCTNPRWLLKK